MWSYLKKLWVNYRAVSMVRSAKETIEDRLEDYSLVCVVSDALTLTAYQLDPDDSSLCWDGTANFPFWGKNLQIYVNTSGRVSSVQKAILKMMLTHPDSIRDHVLATFADWYTGKIYPQRESWEMDLPAVTSPEEMHALIGDPSIRLDESTDASKVRFSLEFLPPWRDTDIDMFITNWRVDDSMFCN